ncbi:glutathione S-transferase [Thiomicrorhabdus immobilis]|uniref:Glutathione S-transferase n=1 Tax=Thiomicrorhabdus immobilis TaxID=2791037 RepID=A0ABM7MB87_9GAMM|nr:glutathione S-transferase [Thiomicrorhabdus immobilis]BCN92621.1 glutathione S-transferase [Thiomicrorhabdus immobilis]
MDKHPILYSYRRCPYAMRARMAIAFSGVQVEQREIVFWDKPEQMLLASPKGTVPVLILPDGQVIDESRDIMLWALNQDEKSYQAWLFTENAHEQAQINDWIDACDNEFKTHLDHYKYADQYPEYSEEHYRELGCDYLRKLENAIKENSQSDNIDSEFTLINGRITMADIAVFPFVRQFANVNKDWFAHSDFVYLQRWLEKMLALPYFVSIMKNRPVWNPSHNALWVDEPELIYKNQFVAKAEAS